MEISTLKRRKASPENWEETVMEIVKWMASPRSTEEWDLVMNALSHFSDEYREAGRFIKYWRSSDYQPLLQLFKSYRVHRLTNTAHFGPFCQSHYVKNIKKVALDYRDEDEDYVGLHTFFRSRNFISLQEIRFKHIPITDEEEALLMQNLDRFPDLKQIDFIGSETWSEKLLTFLKNQGIRVRTAPYYSDFVNQGYDFWK